MSGRSVEPGPLVRRPYHQRMVRTARSPVLIGRDRELQDLDKLLAEASEGRPCIAIVAGEAGIGKSRLLAELGRIAEERNARVLIGGCLDMAGGSVPFLPVIEVLRGLVRSSDPQQIDEWLGPARAELALLLPELDVDSARGSGAGDRADPARQARLFEAVLGLIGRLSAAQPVLLVIEDVHWIDAASRDVITFLSRNLTSERALIALTYRTDDLARDGAALVWLTELARRPRVTRIGLDRLDRAAVGRQIEAIAGADAGHRLGDSVWARSDGNPYFVEELVDAAVAGDGTDAAPTTLEAMLALRLEGASRAAQEVIGAVAVCGRTADEDLLEAMVGKADLRDGLREAIDRQVLELDRSSGTFWFRHALLREVAERRLLPGERRALHERCATTLAARPDLANGSPAGAASELAHHWDAAGNADEAYLAAITAARAAELVAAHAQALVHYERALYLEASASEAVRTDRVDLLRRTADVADFAYQTERAIAHVTEALSLVDEAADPTSAGLLHGRLGYLRWASGDGPIGLEHHLEAVRLVAADPATRERARVLGGLGGALMGVGRYSESADVSRSAIECAVTVGARSEEARARNMLGSDLVALGQVEAGLSELHQSRVIATESGPPEMLVVTHHNLALNLAQAGRLEDALAEAEAGREAARRFHLERRFGPDLAAIAGDTLLRLGRWDEASAVACQGLDLDPSRRGTVYLSAVRGRLHALRGDAEAARERFEISDSLAAGDVDPHLAAFVARGRAEMFLGAAQPARAVAVAQKALEELGGAADPAAALPVLALGLRAAADLASAARAARNEEATAGALGQAEPMHQMLLAMSDRKADQGLGPLVELAAAEWERVSGSYDASPWLAAAERLDALPDPYLSVYALYRGAEAELRAHGMRAAAAEPLAAAHATASRLGARPLARAVEQLALRARVSLTVERAPREAVRVDVTPSPPMSRRKRPAGLSTREVEVLRLLAAGKSNGEIAERLFITRKTAAVHVTHILDKLGVTNRVEAAMTAASLGLTEVDEASVR